MKMNLVQGITLISQKIERAWDAIMGALMLIGVAFIAAFLQFLMEIWMEKPDQ
jgi:hypothetical protein